MGPPLWAQTVGNGWSGLKPQVFGVILFVKREFRRGLDQGIDSSGITLNPNPETPNPRGVGFRVLGFSPIPSIEENRP